MPKPIPDRTFDPDEIGRPKLTMIYGPPGGGKTVLASQYPAPQVWLDFDQGIDSIFWAVKKGICPHNFPDDFRFATPEDEWDSQFKLVRASGYWQSVDKVNDWLSDEKIDTWRTLVIDPITTLNEMSMHAGLEISGRYPSPSKPYSTSGKATKESGVLLIQIQDYKPAQSLIDQFARQLKKICKQHGKWVIFTAHLHERTKSGGVGDEPSVIGVEPQLFGKQRRELLKEFDEVYYINNEGTKVNPEFKIQTVGDSFTRAKSRFGCLDPREPASFDNIRQKVKAFYGVDLK